MALRLRRGTNAERLTVTPESGEIIYVTDSKKLYVGDGSTVGGNLVSGVNNIIDDATPQLGGDLDLNSNNIIGNGNININGTITATGNINLGDGAGGDVISVGGEVSGSLVPTNDESFTLGSPSNRWQAVWASSAVISGQVDAVAVNANIIADDSTVAFDASTGTFVGNITGNASGAHTGTLDGDVTGSVFGDDSTLLVDGVGKALSANTVTVDFATIGNQGLYINGSGSLVTTGRIEFDYTDPSSASTVLSTFVTRDNGQQKFVIQTRPFNTYLSHEDNGNNGLTMYSNYAVYGGMNLRINPGNDTFTNPTDALQVDGDATVTGRIASTFVGSLASDDSTVVVDNNGTIVNLAFSGNVAGTPGDTGTVDSWLQVSVNGVTKYIPLYA